MSEVVDSSQSLEDRYGSGRRRSLDRRVAWTAVALLLAAGVAFLLFSGWQTTSRVSVQDIGFTKTGGNSVDVKFSVSAPANAAVACAVEALSMSKATVGWKVIELPVTKKGTHTVTTSVITTGPFSAASAKSCWEVDQQGS